MKAILIWRGLLPCVVLAGTVAAAKASTTGQIYLRAVVPARAAIRMIGLANPMTVDVGNVADGTAVFRLSRFTNVASGVTVSLASTARAFTDDAGASVPYVVRFGGKDVAFNDGAADLTALSQADTVGDAGGELQIVAPTLVTAGERALADQLVLTITAR